MSLNTYLGIDVGSVTTKLALVDEEGKYVDSYMLKTAGKPVEAVQKGLKQILAQAIQEYNIEIENIRQASAQRGVDDIIESHKMTDLENQAEFTEGIIDYLKEADKGISKDYYNKLIQNEEAKVPFSIFSS